MEPQRREDFERAWRTTLLVCLAMVAVVPFMLGAAALVETPPAPEAGSQQTLLLLFGAIAVAGAAASLATGRFVREGSVNAASRRALQAGVEFSRADALIGVMLVSCVVTYALAEIPLLVGLTYYFISGSWVAFLGFAGLTILGYALTFPRKSAWEAWIDEAEALDAGYAPIVS